MLTRDELEWLYPYDKPRTYDKERIAKAYHIANDIQLAALRKQVLHEDNSSHDGMRCSSMGKHPLDILGRKFFPRAYDLVSGATLQPRIQQLFLDGDVFEAHYIFWLLTREYAVDLSLAQGEVLWRGSVPGHFDYVVQLPNRKFVLLELKTANSHYYGSLLRERKYEAVLAHYGSDVPFATTSMTDFRGHVTQSALYRDCLKDGLFAVDATVIVVKNKDNAALLLYELPDDDSHILNECEHIVNAYNTIETWESAICTIAIPDPKLELRSRKRTGRYLLPPTLYGSPIVPLLYDWVAEHDRTFLTGYAIPKGTYKIIKDGIKRALERWCTDGGFGVAEYDMNDAGARISDWLSYTYLRTE